MPFNVIQGHRFRCTNRKPICDFLLVIILTYMLSHIGLYRSKLSQIIVRIFKFDLDLMTFTYELDP